MLITNGVKVDNTVVPNPTPNNRRAKNYCYAHAVIHKEEPAWRHIILFRHKCLNIRTSYFEYKHVRRKKNDYFARRSPGAVPLFKLGPTFRKLDIGNFIIVFDLLTYYAVVEFLKTINKNYSDIEVGIGVGYPPEFSDAPGYPDYMDDVKEATRRFRHFLTQTLNRTGARPEKLYDKLYYNRQHIPRFVDMYKEIFNMYLLEMITNNKIDIVADIQQIIKEKYDTLNPKQKTLYDVFCDYNLYYKAHHNAIEKEIDTMKELLMNDVEAAKAKIIS